MKIELEINKHGLAAITAAAVLVCSAHIYQTYRESNVRQTLAERAKPIDFAKANEPISFARNTEFLKNKKRKPN